MVNRLQKDTFNLFKNPPPDTILDVDHNGGEDMSTVSFIILGPESTAYFGGGWRVTLQVPPEYPQQPPKAYFKTKIFHPNVQPTTGEVCVDTLKRDWEPKLDFGTIILVSIHISSSLLCASAGTDCILLLLLCVLRY